MTEVTDHSLAIKAERGEIPTTAKDRSFGHWDSIFVMASFGVATWNYVLGGWIASFVGFCHNICNKYFIAASNSLTAVKIIEETRN